MELFPVRQSSFTKTSRLQRELTRQRGIKPTRINKSREPIARTPELRLLGAPVECERDRDFVHRILIERAVDVCERELQIAANAMAESEPNPCFVIIWVQ